MLPLALRCAVLLCGLAAALPSPAAPLITSPNGRKVLEIRTGAQPNTGLLRTLVITAGPMAQTTSLMVNTSFVGDLFRPDPPPMTWTVLVSSGTLFSLGGGCARGNQVDFPYINNNKLAIARFVGPTSTIITNTINSAADYQSVNCVSAPDEQATYYILVNGTARRTEIWKQAISNVFTLERQMNLEARLPFNGAIRPTIGRMLRTTLPGRSDGAKAVPTDFFLPNTYLVIDQLLSSTIRAQTFDALSTQVSPELAFAGNPASLPPQEIVQRGGCVGGDFNADGTLEMREAANSNCFIPTATVPNLGSSRGQNGYTYASPAVTHYARRRLVLMHSSTCARMKLTGATVAPSVHAGTDGPFDECPFGPTFPNEESSVVLGPQTGDNTSIRYEYVSTPHPDVIFSSLGFDSGPARDGDFVSLLCEGVDIR